jgi:hypothetical protein
VVTPLNSVAPINKALDALLPQGPQKVVLTYSAPATSTAPAQAVTESGYINFSGADPTLCSMSITATAGATASASSPASQVSFTDTKAKGQVAFDVITAATGNYKSDPLNTATPFDFPAHTPIVIPTPSFMASSNEGLCSFGQLARYASLSSSGSITWAPSKLKAIDTYYAESFYRPIIAASSNNNRLKNSVYKSLIATVIPTNIKATLDVFHATLQKHAGSVTYDQTSPSKVTITFTPATTSSVPKNKQPSFQQEAVAYAKTAVGAGAIPSTYKP